MRWSWSLMLVCAVPVHATVYTLPMPTEVQRESQLCWAAVSVMATRAFPATSSYRAATQDEVVTYHRAGLDTLLPLNATTIPQALKTARLDCDDLSKCNEAGSPWLLGLEHTRLGDLGQGTTTMLSTGHFLHDLGDRRRPIIIRWIYGNRQQPGNSTRLGGHALIVTGYDSSNHDVRIWDPWPAFGMPEPPPGRRERWIPMTKYANPENDDGVPVVADHESDEFALRRKRSNLALDKYPQPIPIPVSDISGPVEIDWAIAFPDLAEPVGAFMRSHKVRESSGKYTNGPFTTDAPFPIVGLRTEQLLQSAAQPDALLVPRTSAFVVPILKDGIAVDSFMLLHRRGGWSEGGYSSNHIANLCNVLRAKHGVGAAGAKDYYLVSIPEQGAFFIGRGFKDQAKLLSLGNDGKGEFAPAREVLERLIRQIPRAQTPGATHDR